MVKSRKASTKRGKTKMDYTKLRDPAAIAAAEQKYRPLDTPPRRRNTGPWTPRRGQSPSRIFPPTPNT